MPLSGSNTMIYFLRLTSRPRSSWVSARFSTSSSGNRRDRGHSVMTRVIQMGLTTVVAVAARISHPNLT